MICPYFVAYSLNLHALRGIQVGILMSMDITDKGLRKTYKHDCEVNFGHYTKMIQHL